MKVSLLKKDKKLDFILPEEIFGSYWISDIDSKGIKQNLISIEAFNNTWKLVSNTDVFYMENNMMQPYAILQNNKFYTIKNRLTNEALLLYSYNIEQKYNSYDITELIESGVTIGKYETCHIHYKYLEKEDFILKKENGNVYLINNSTRAIYVNNVAVSKKQILKIGDVVFTYGLMFYFYKSNIGGKEYYYLGLNNLDNRNVKTTLMQAGIKRDVTEFKEDEEVEEIQLYSESDYFHKVPRFIPSIKPLQINVDAPPGKEEEQNNSTLLTVGPMLTMSMTSMVTGYTAINGVLSGSSTWSSALPSLVMCGAMFASMFIWPTITRKYEKSARKRKEKNRQKKYKAYIDSKRNDIVNAKAEQSKILCNNYPNTKECQEIILNKYTTLWQRRIEDDDYLIVNLGYGNYPMKINIKYPEDHFSMAEDNLKDMVQELGNEPKMLANVPVIYSIKNNYISGLVGENLLISNYFKQLIIQIMAHHSYDNLKIVVFTDEEKQANWNFIKDLPHLFTDDKSLRFFGTNNDEYKEICYYLDRVLNQRKETKKEINDLDKIYLIITDSFKAIRNFDVIDNILNSKINLGFSLFILDNKITDLPDQCKSFISLHENFGELHEGEYYIEPLKFNYEINSDLDYEACVCKLANIPIEINDNKEGQLPDKLGFLEMFDVGKIEQLNPVMRWQKNNPIMSLQAPCGYGKNGEKISIDLHEKFHGPHGLIAGSTGSGKSEFIITYILSMAVNYHPYEVQFILIDYKGGGLAGAFENSKAGVKLPHLVGTITNLDLNEIKRSLASIESELRRRQSLFNKAREASGESTIDIYKYQKMYREGMVDEPISHLFIISDEFAELKTQQPEFMAQLISTARIGRSLGVHLILATQKPSGVVDPQIWSNTRFRVCMRVQEKSDSNEVIKCPDAAFLKQTGRFYFQVGYNEVFVLGQAAWAGGKYIPQEKVKKNIDTSIDFIDNIGYSIKNVDTKKKENVSSLGEELSNLVKYLDNTAKKLNIATKPLWLERIKEFIKIEDLALKYNYNKIPFDINPIIGEYDIPNNQQQALLTLPISKEGNALIYGAAGSGKENFITTLIYSSMLYYTSNELNYYIIDYGTGALKMFKDCPIVGDIISLEDEDKLENLFKLVQDTISERKYLFAEYNGNYENYCKNSGQTVPNIVIIINNFENYDENCSKYEEILNKLTREANNYGIYFVATVNTPNGMRFKLKQNFSTIYVLQQNNDDDYTTILGNVYKTYPSKIFGRGIIKTDAVYEFQTALVTERDNITSYIKTKCKSFKELSNTSAKKIPVLPDVVSYIDIKDDIKDNVVLGLSKEDLKPYKFDFNKNYITIVTSLDFLSTKSFINPLINQIIFRNKEKLIVINADEYEFDLKYTKYYNYVNNNFDAIFNELNNIVQTNYDLYQKNNFDKTVFKDFKRIKCIIAGIDSFKSKLSDENKTNLDKLFTDAKDLGIIDFIIVDSIDKIKKIELESWYRSTVNNTYGIWLGNGINDQFSLKISQRIDEMKQNVPNGFCFVIERGKPTYLKYVEKFDLNIK